jgi:glycosyltransferase involved in cell wall biosynthesis
MDPVTVVTVTRVRPQLLRRAIASVKAQDHADVVRHVVIVDGCTETMNMLDTPPYAMDVLITSVHEPRCAGDRDGPARLARLRNRSLDLVDTPWVCFLDDDNTFARDHVSSLVSTARATGCPAVHSQRRMFNRDGRPYNEPQFPWTRDAEAAAVLYADGVRRGVFEPGSNIVRDQVDLDRRWGGARIVDMNAWLLDVDLLRTVRFREAYDYRDWLYLVAEDTKLLRDLVARKVAIACTGLTTLNYYLGGYSNSFEEPDHDWLEEPVEDCRADLEAIRRFPPSWR